MLVICLVFIIVGSTNGLQTASKKKIEGTGDPANPGVILHLTQVGMDYINEVITEILTDQLSKLTLPDITKRDNKGYFEIRKISVNRFDSPRATSLMLVPPKGIKWKMRGMSLSLFSPSAMIDYRTLMHLQGQGTVLMNVDNIDFDMTANVLRGPKGTFQLKTTSCKLTIGSMNAHAEGTGNVISLFNTYQHMFLGKAKSKIQEKGCEAIRRHIDGIVSNKLAEMTMKSPLRANGTNCNKNNPFIKCSNTAKSNRDITNQMPLDRMYFDYSLTEQPRVTTDFIETKHRGEISWDGRDATSFHPKKMRVNNEADMMIHAFISDYVLNSFFYHLYRQDKAMFNLNASHSGMKDFLRINCDSGDQCIGDVLPGMKSKFPNQLVELRLKSTTMPIAEFTDDLIEVFLESFVGVYARESPNSDRKFAMLAGMAVTADLKDVRVDPKEAILHAKADLKDFQYKVKTSRVGDITAAKEKELAKIAEKLLHEGVNLRLAEGIPLPRMDAAELVDPEVKIRKDTLQITTDLEANLELLKKEADKEVKAIIDQLANEDFIGIP